MVGLLLVIMDDITLVIEHCEPQVSEWLMLEYRHASKIWENVVFSNVKSKEARRKLAPIGRVEKVPFYELFKAEEMIILDPKGSEKLETRDFESAKAVVIGGILGYSQPLGRTQKLISSKVKGAKVRNLGEKQLTIDTATLVARMIYGGMKLEDIDITSEVEIVQSENERTVLPYGYVILDKKVLLTPGLIEYLSQK
jgi:ribosome biogenesis SPOUT family RNA methylase Rps3